MHVRPANHSIRPAAKGSRFALRAGGRSYSAFVRGTCLAPAQWREHPGYKSMPRLGRGRLAPKRAMLPERDRVQSQREQGASPTRSTPSLVKSEFVVRDSTYRRCRGLFLSKRLPDLTRRLAVRVSTPQCDAPKRSIAGLS